MVTLDVLLEEMPDCFYKELVPLCTPSSMLSPIFEIA